MYGGDKSAEAYLMNDEFLAFADVKAGWESGGVGSTVDAGGIEYWSGIIAVES